MFLRRRTPLYHPWGGGGGSISLCPKVLISLRRWYNIPEWAPLPQGSHIDNSPIDGGSGTAGSPQRRRSFHTPHTLPSGHWVGGSGVCFSPYSRRPSRRRRNLVGANFICSGDNLAAAFATLGFAAHHFAARWPVWRRLSVRVGGEMAARGRLRVRTLQIGRRNNYF